MVNRPPEIQEKIYVLRGECPDCKEVLSSGEYNGHVDLQDGVCPDCGGEYHG